MLDIYLTKKGWVLSIHCRYSRWNRNLEVSDDASSISVEMGQVSFHSDVIPVSVEGEAREVLNEEINPNGKTYKYYAGTIGNLIA